MPEVLDQTQTATSPPTTEEKDGICGICPAGCFVRITLSDGKIVETIPLPDHPLGNICTNGVHSGEIVHDPQRVQYPMRRVGPKGSYEFERISWDAAFDLITERMQAIKAAGALQAEIRLM